MSRGDLAPAPRSSSRTRGRREERILTSSAGLGAAPTIRSISPTALHHDHRRDAGRAESVLPPRVLVDIALDDLKSTDRHGPAPGGSATTGRVHTRAPRGRPARPPRVRLDIDVASVASPPMEGVCRTYRSAGDPRALGRIALRAPQFGQVRTERGPRRAHRCRSYPSCQSRQLCRVSRKMVGGVAEPTLTSTGQPGRTPGHGQHDRREDPDGHDDDPETPTSYCGERCRNVHAQAAPRAANPAGGTADTIVRILLDSSSSSASQRTVSTGNPNLSATSSSSSWVGATRSAHVEHADARARPTAAGPMRRSRTRSSIRTPRVVDSWRASLYLALPSHRRPDDGIGARIDGAQFSEPRSSSGGAPAPVQPSTFRETTAVARFGRAPRHHAGFSKRFRRCVPNRGSSLPRKTSTTRSVDELDVRRGRARTPGAGRQSP